MTRSFKLLTACILPAILGIVSFPTPVLGRPMAPSLHGIEDVSARAANTCADPSLANTVFEAFDSSGPTHYMDFHFRFVHTDTAEANGPPTKWSFQGPMFQAWITQQPFTTPLFALVNPTATEFIFQLGVDAQTPPTMSGFRNAGLVFWVYNTPVCNSIPLMTAVFPSRSDHYYTVDPFEHAGLLSEGWTDGGVVAYVLPLPTS